MLTLDLQCPVAWKSVQANSSSSILASTTSLAKQPSLISDNVHYSANSHCADYDEEWLQRRYSETLWLGEDHSPLVGFLQHLRRFERRRQSYSPLQVIDSLADLLKSRQEIRKRFTAATSAAFGENALEKIIQVLCRRWKGNEQVDNLIEKRVVQIALESGPGLLVGVELRDSVKAERAGKMTRLWLQAMESRELQIQILLVLNLLRLSTRLPAMSSTCTMKSVQTDGDREQDQKRAPLGPTQPDIHGVSASAATKTIAVTKRKRKSDNAKRWTGGKGMAAFPWTLQRQTSREDNLTNITKTDDGKEEKSTSPESLSKRFETLLDSLCLQVLTCNLSVDVEHIPTNQSPLQGQQPVKATEQKKGRVQPWQMFGTEGRRREKSRGDKDVLQWLCCHIIEPQFSKTLPRQCGIVRGKCFIPGSGSTPAKPARKEISPLQRLPPPSKTIDAKKQSTKEQKDMEEERRQRQFLSRAKSQSPAPMPWSLLREEEEEVRKMQPLNSSLIGKWDARTVTVRKKWNRSQSIGPMTTRENVPTAAELSGHLQPVATITDIALSTMEKREASIERRESKTGIVKRCESQTFVMDTPQKGQTFGGFSRSNSFSAQSHLHTLKTNTSTAATSLASWRRTESQPVLSLGIKRKLDDAIEWSSDEEDE